MLRSREPVKGSADSISRTTGFKLRTLVGNTDQLLLESGLFPSCRLASAWERLKCFDAYADYDQTIPDETWIELSTESAKKFVAEVRKCTSLEPPLDWQQAIRHCEPVSGETFINRYNAGIPHRTASVRASTNRVRFLSSESDPLRDGDSALRSLHVMGVMWEGKQVEQIEEPIRLWKNSSFLVISFENVQVALEAGGMGAKTLFATERGSGKIRWGSESWDNGEVGTWRGPGIRNAKWLNLNGREAGVFGVTTYGIFLETFDLTDGAPLCRFSSSYWDPTLWNVGNFEIRYRRG